jgi:hypothetical protein
VAAIRLGAPFSREKISPTSRVAAFTCTRSVTTCPRVFMMDTQNLHGATFCEGASQILGNVRMAFSVYAMAPLVSYHHDDVTYIRCDQRPSLDAASPQLGWIECCLRVYRLGALDGQGSPRNEINAQSQSLAAGCKLHSYATEASKPA